MKVGRKWNIAVIGDDLCEVATSGNSSGAVAEDFFNGDDVVSFGTVGDVFDGKLVAGMKFAAINNVIDIAIVFFEYDKFARATVGELCKDARAHNASIVEDE